MSAISLVEICQLILDIILVLAGKDNIQLEDEVDTGNEPGPSRSSTNNVEEALATPGCSTSVSTDMPSRASASQEIKMVTLHDVSSL